MITPDASPTLAMNERVNALWAEGIDVLHLGFGESRFPVHPALSKAFQENIHQRSYLPSLGNASLRTAIAKYYSEKLNLSFDAEQILIGVGSKSLLYAMIQSIDGDLLLSKPSWVSYSSIAKLTGKSVHWFELDRDDEFGLSIASLESCYNDACAIGSDPQILVLNSPNNPVGNNIKPDMVESVAKWARDKDIFILSDEVYSLVTHDGFIHHTPAASNPERTIIFGGLSKHLSLGGWRFGMAILPKNDIGKQLSKSFQSIAGSVWSCVPAPIQATAELAYSGDRDIDAYIQTCTEIHRIRTNHIYQGLNKMGLKSPTPKGGFYLYPSFSKWTDKLNEMGILTCNDLSNHLMNQLGIAALPGSAFGDDPENLCLRFSTSYLDMETDQLAQKIIDAYEKENQSESFLTLHHPRIALFLEKLGSFISELDK